MDRSAIYLAQLERNLKRIPWWVGPAFLLALGVGATILALAFSPGPDQWTQVFGYRFGEECASYKMAGVPCPQCGMTRSWTHGVRLRWVEAFFYNPAGLLLLWWLQASGLIGAWRLFKRDPKAATVRPNWLLVWVLLWIAAYTVGYGLRLAGYLPLARVGLGV